MTFQVLAATMKQRDFSKVDEMNIRSDVVFANQADETKYEEKNINGCKAKMITTTTRGVGINRNLALMYADADICLMADDDMVYNDGYAEGIKAAFEELPDADVIIFCCELWRNGEMIGKAPLQTNRVGHLSTFKYGIHIAVKMKRIKEKNINFSTLFGGGAAYSSGEDSLFIADCFKKGLKVYTHKFCIGKTTKDESTWFNGFTKKFLYDKGAFYSAMSERFAKVLCLQLILRHRNIYKEAGVSFFEAYKLMKSGIKGLKTLKTYEEFAGEGNG